MSIVWSPDLETGVFIIDGQHKELFERINRLLDACRKGEGAGKVGETMVFLQSYVVEHFAMEEQIMRRAKYERYREHAQEHREFRNRIDALSREIYLEGVFPHTVVRINRTIVDWLNNHIRRSDRAMAAKLREFFSATGVTA